MAANTLTCFLRMTGFLDTEIAPAIKPTPQNKDQNVDTKSPLYVAFKIFDRCLEIYIRKHSVVNYIFIVFITYYKNNASLVRYI